jgi:hypothetical protein
MTGEAATWHRVNQEPDDLSVSGLARRMAAKAALVPLDSRMPGERDLSYIVIGLLDGKRVEIPVSAENGSEALAKAAAQWSMPMIRAERV